MYYWRVFTFLTLYHFSIFCCPTFGKNDNLKSLEQSTPVHLTSKRSLESHLWSVLNPFNQEMASKGGGLHQINSKYTSIQKVPQDLEGEEREEIVHDVHDSHDDKRLTSHPFSDYLIWLRSGECPQREDGVTEYFCPSPDKRTGRWSCINDAQLCDQMRDCPNDPEPSDEADPKFDLERP